MKISTAALALLIGLVPAAASSQETPGARPSDHPIAHVATTPLRDLNIVKEKVPPLLEAVMKAPYSRRGTATCAQLAAGVRALNGVLGADVDAAATAKNSVALALAASAAGGILPGEGIIRHVTGASANARHYAEAVYAGSVRRGFLKGLGAAKGCPAPAAPR